MPKLFWTYYRNFFLSQIGFYLVFKMLGYFKKTYFGLLLVWLIFILEYQTTFRSPFKKHLSLNVLPLWGRREYSGSFPANQLHLAMTSLSLERLCSTHSSWNERHCDDELCWRHMPLCLKAFCLSLNVWLMQRITVGSLIVCLLLPVSVFQLWLSSCFFSSKMWLGGLFVCFV